MVRVFLYEFASGGGLWSWGAEDGAYASLLSEGAGMLAALAEDFCRVPGVEVIALRDCRLADLPLPGCRVQVVSSASEEIEALAACAHSADWTLLIAPEMGGALLDRCRQVERLGSRLLGPGSALVRLASDKQATATRLSARGIPVPAGVLLEAGAPLPRDFPYPAVLKPNDGAGSYGVCRVRGPDDARAHPGSSRRRLERWHAGFPASVALLCGPRGAVPLAPCAQKLSDDGHYRYLGGWTPLPEPLARRARHLALRAAKALPASAGYVGIDLLLGPDGSDWVIEVNPRLTTSYLGLRRLAHGNLAQAMLAAAAGQPVGLTFRHDHVEFAPVPVSTSPRAWTRPGPTFT